MIHICSLYCLTAKKGDKLITYLIIFLDTYCSPGVRQYVSTVRLYRTGAISTTPVCNLFRPQYRYTPRPAKEKEERNLGEERRGGEVR